MLKSVKKLHFKYNVKISITYISWVKKDRYFFENEKMGNI